MQPTSASDYQQLLTNVIKKQIVILGPDITLSKARNVKGLTVANDGTVTRVEGSPQEVTQALIDQFVQLSGLIVKKTMEPLLSLSQQTMSQQSQPSAPVVTPIPEMTPPAPTVATTPVVPSPSPLSTPAQQTTQPVAESSMPMQSTIAPQDMTSPINPTPPTKNPQVETQVTQPIGPMPSPEIPVIQSTPTSQVPSQPTPSSTPSVQPAQNPLAA